VIRAHTQGHIASYVLGEADKVPSSNCHYVQNTSVCICGCISMCLSMTLAAGKNVNCVMQPSGQGKTFTFLEIKDMYNVFPLKGMWLCTSVCPIK